MSGIEIAILVVCGLLVVNGMAHAVLQERRRCAAEQAMRARQARRAEDARARVREQERKRKEREIEREQSRIKSEKKRVSALDDRLSSSASMAALLKAIDQAEKLMLDSDMSSYELAKYPRLSVLHNSGSHEIVNDFMEKKFSELRDTALEPVNLSDFCKKADAIRKSIDIAYDDMPRQSQTVYLNYKEEVFGDE